MAKSWWCLNQNLTTELWGRVMIWVILSASAIVATFNHAAAGQMINDRRSGSVNVPYMVNYELPELPYYRLEDVEYYPPYADPDLSTEPAQFYRSDIHLRPVKDKLTDI